ncbi:MAG: UbiA family prenyltransferase [Saprospiraceae bacterium]|nr:UbiA family prenyltransferase [Saprospiraceae bacterium]
MIQKYLSLIKFSHTIFALPFAIVGYLTGILYQNQGFDLMVFIKVVLSMVFARNAAMAFNRFLDRDIDKLNPRTQAREIPAGIIHEKNVLIFVIINSLLFIATSFSINTLCFILSPVALGIILGYSYTKRFTFYCHFILGLGLALAPVGAFLAITGIFHYLPVLLGFSVLFWVAGFDIIYSLQDDNFDRNHNLQSIPAKLGRKGALLVSRILHLSSIIIIILFTWYSSSLFTQLDYILYIGTAVFISMLVYQHSLVKENDLRRVGVAFFTFNGIASLTFGLLFTIDSLLL